MSRGFPAHHGAILRTKEHTPMTIIDRGSVIARTLHAAFVAATEHVRDRLGAADMGSFSLTIAASGRTLSDKSEVKIEYRLGKSTYGTAVTGNDLERTIKEMLRREGWNETNAPLALSGPKVISRAPTYVEEDNELPDRD
jgi:hypothetical protein